MFVQEIQKSLTFPWKFTNIIIINFKLLFSKIYHEQRAHLLFRTLQALKIKMEIKLTWVKPELDTYLKYA